MISGSTPLSMNSSISTASIEIATHLSTRPSCHHVPTSSKYPKPTRSDTTTKTDPSIATLNQSINQSINQSSPSHLNSVQKQASLTGNRQEVFPRVGKIQPHTKVFKPIYPINLPQRYKYLPRSSIVLRAQSHLHPADHNKKSIAPPIVVRRSGWKNRTRN